MATRAERHEIGWALQTAESSPAANPAFVVQGQFNPSSPEPTQEIAVREPALPTGTTQTILKATQSWKASLQIPCDALTLGPLIKGILSSESVSGSYRHTFIPDTTDRWLTLFGQRPGGLYEKFWDGQIESITLGFESGEPLDLGIVAMGKASSILGSAYTPGTTVQTGAADDWLTYVGAEVKLDIDSTPATTITPYIESGSIQVSRASSLIPSADGSIPIGIRRGPFNIKVSLEATWDSWDAYRATFYGSTAGSAQSTTLVTGSLILKTTSRFTATRELTVKIPELLLLAEPVQPGSGILTQRLEGYGTYGGSAASTQWELLNAQSAAY